MASIGQQKSGHRSQFANRHNPQACWIEPKQGWIEPKQGWTWSRLRLANLLPLALHGNPLLQLARKGGGGAEA